MRTYVRMRWDELKVDVSGTETMAIPGIGDGTVVRRFEAPEAMGIRFHEVRAKSVLNRVPGGRYGFNWTVNPYRGCTHACSFCFARPTHTYLGWNAGRDFEREIVVKVNTPERLRAELARPAWRRELVALGTNTDPYQWVEGRYRMMPEILAVLEEARTPVSVLSKSPLVLRDIDHFARLAKRLPVSVNLSVPTLDEKVWRETEPHTPHPRARLEAVAELRRRGIDSGVMVAPLMPGSMTPPSRSSRSRKRPAKRAPRSSPALPCTCAVRYEASSSAGCELSAPISFPNTSASTRKAAAAWTPAIDAGPRAPCAAGVVRTAPPGEGPTGSPAQRLTATQHPANPAFSKPLEGLWSSRPRTQGGRRGECT